MALKSSTNYLELTGDKRMNSVLRNDDSYLNKGMDVDDFSCFWK